MNNLTKTIGQILVDSADQQVAPNIVEDLVYDACLAAGQNEQQAIINADHAFELAGFVKVITD